MKATKLRIVRDDEHVKVFGSPEFIARTRNVSLPSPTKFQATIKKPGDITI